MDLILWRHADAEDGADDLARPLTPKGRKQAQRVAAWLDARLPRELRILVSPALRAQETVRPLARPFETVAAMAPGAAASAVLEAAGWPGGEGAVLVVGHQPTLGAAVALALTRKPAEWRLRKGGLWWLSTRRDDPMPLVRAVMTPDLA